MTEDCVHTGVTNIVSGREMINVDISTIDNYNTEQGLETMVWVDI